jgi:hypothetical protein
MNKELKPIADLSARHCSKPNVGGSLQSKYSLEFERDFKWYLKMRTMFNFDGSNSYHNKKGQDIIIYDKNGVSGKEAFYKWDSNGKILPTKHPNILHTLLKTKGSVNLHIKMYAEDRAKGLFPLIEFRAFCIKYKCPTWFKEAVERQKFKYYDVSTQ